MAPAFRGVALGEISHRGYVEKPVPDPGSGRQFRRRGMRSAGPADAPEPGPVAA